MTTQDVMSGLGDGNERVDLATLSQADQQLVALAEELGDLAESVCSLVEDGPTAHDLRKEDWEDAKREARKQLERALRGAKNLREETGAPYRDARMLLTELIFSHGHALRMYRAAEGPSAPTSEGEDTVIAVGASQALSFVGTFYPTLGAKMSEPARAEVARRAIDSVARSSHRVPWQLIAAVWGGIGQEHDPERWRKDWTEHRARRQ